MESFISDSTFAPTECAPLTGLSPSPQRPPNRFTFGETDTEKENDLEEKSNRSGYIEPDSTKTSTSKRAEAMHVSCKALLLLVKQRVRHVQVLQMCTIDVVTIDY